MKQHLLKRGYTKGCINDAINKASKVPREASLEENHDQQKLDRVPFVITYNPPAAKSSKITKRLSDNPRCFRKMQNSLHNPSSCELQERKKP